MKRAQKQERVRVFLAYFVKGRNNGWKTTGYQICDSTIILCRLLFDYLTEHASIISISILISELPPTNTNFQLTFLLTRLQEALYEDLPV